MPYIPEAEAHAYRYGARVGIFFRLAVEPTPVRICVGVNDFPIGIDILDAAGTIYRGGGRLEGIPDLDILINGESERVEFLLSGIPDDVATVTDIATNMPSVKGKECVIGMAQLSKNWQAVAPVRRLWKGNSDFWALQEVAGTGSQRAKRTFILSCGGGDTARIRSRRSTWTPAQHRLSHPTDAFCDRTPRYVPSYEVVFPRF